jgi:hypothetical protein
MNKKRKDPELTIDRVSTFRQKHMRKTSTKAGK